MPNYYVRPDGNNGNNGLSSSAQNAWQTITYALANMSLGAGDNYLYIAPGVYRESPTVTITPSSTNRLIISGNPTASQFSGLQAGQVRVTGSTSDSTTMATGHRLNLGAKTYITIENLFIEVNGSSSSSFGIYGTANNITIQKCVIYSYYTNTGSLGGCIGFVFSSATNNAISISQCILRGSPYCIFTTTPAISTGISGVTVQNCALISNGTSTSYGYYHAAQSGATATSVFITNCIACGHANGGIWLNNGNATNVHIVQNCLLFGNQTGIYSTQNTNTSFYNIFNNAVNANGLSTGATSQVTDFIGVDFGQSLLQGFSNLASFGSILGSRNQSFGTASNATVS